MTTTRLDITRDEFLNVLMETDYYKTITTTLHEKYKDKMVQDDYPEEYWNEFNDQFDQLVKDVLNGTLK